MIFGKDLNCNVLNTIPCDRPNPLQYFLVPDIEVENGGDDEDLDDEEEVDENVVAFFCSHTIPHNEISYHNIT